MGATTFRFLILGALALGLGCSSGGGSSPGDGGASDGGAADGATLDGGAAPDAEVDASLSDAAARDGGVSDGAVVDGDVPRDAASEDAAAPDGGPPDAGFDGGRIDAGPQPCTAPLRAAIADADFDGYSIFDAPEMVRNGGDQNLEADYAGFYRDDLATHPGCVPRPSYDGNTERFSSDNEAAVPPGVPYTGGGYRCAAKRYDQPHPDTSKPIVILVHGNSSSPGTFEEYFVAERAGDTITNDNFFTFTVDPVVRPQLATELLAQGYEVIAFDARIDRVEFLGDYDDDAIWGNLFLNVDHGWTVPLLQHLIESVIRANPGRRLSLVGHSLGASTIRDALRRLWLARDVSGVNPLALVQDVVLLSGAAHGTRFGNLGCSSYSHMRGKIGCELGERSFFLETYFTQPLNGPDEVWGTPCADGWYAWGVDDACGGNVVEYTTLVMEDIFFGSYREEHSSEASSAIGVDGCAENETITLADYDTSAFFTTNFPGLFPNHLGPARSNAGILRVLQKLAD